MKIPRFGGPGTPRGCWPRQVPSVSSRGGLPSSPQDGLPLRRRPLARAPPTSALLLQVTQHSRVDAQQQAWPQEPGPLGAPEGLRVLNPGGQLQNHVSSPGPACRLHSGERPLAGRGGSGLRIPGGQSVSFVCLAPAEHFAGRTVDLGEC